MSSTLLSSMLLFLVLTASLVAVCQSAAPSSVAQLAASNGTIGPYQCSTGNYTLNTTTLPPDSTQWTTVSSSACGKSQRPSLLLRELVLAMMDDGNGLDFQVVDTDANVLFSLLGHKPCFCVSGSDSFNSNKGAQMQLSVRCTNETKAQAPCNIAYYADWRCQDTILADSNNGEQHLPTMQVAVTAMLAAIGLLLAL